jgi:hypothetical protein
MMSDLSVIDPISGDTFEPFPRGFFVATRMIEATDNSIGLINHV